MKANVATPITIAAIVVFMSACNKEHELLNNNEFFRKDESATQVIDYNSINTDMVWEDRVNGVDYTVKSNLVLNARLTIKPGVTVMFEDGAGIQVNEEGAITAIGEDANRILFTSKSGKRGAWKGITVLSNSPMNVFSFCKIEHGGGNNSFGSANLIIGSGDNSAMAEVSHSEITASKTAGILLSKGSKLHGFVHNIIHTNTTFPLTMSFSDVFAIESSNRFSNNGMEFIELSENGRMITEPVALPKCQEPYLVSGEINIGNELKIAPGVKIYMNTNSGITIDGKRGNGSFYAVGQPNQPIQIAAIYNSAGVWGAIKFKSSYSDNNRIEYCHISGGGLTTYGNEGMISVINPEGGMSNITVRNSTIMNSAAIGIYIQSANSEYNSDITTANQFINCAKGNIHIE